MMIASVVIAVGMTEIVGGWGRMARTPAKVKFDWLLFGWSLVLLLLGIQYWLGLWPYIEVEMEYVGEIYFLVVPTLFFVLAAFGVSPDVPLAGSFDSREYYWNSQAAMFLPLSAMIAMAALADLVIVGDEAVEDFTFLVLVSLGLVVFTFAALAFTKRVWIHAVVLALLIIQSIGFFFARAGAIDNQWTG
jgi:hypothetical protein